MFFCYVDESGYNGKRYNPNQPVQVMAGIFPNAYNFHRSDSEFREIFNLIHAEIPISEIKGEQIYRGRGYWANVQPRIRDEVIEFYLDWISARNHKLIITAIDNKAYFDQRESNPNSPYLRSVLYPYLLGGLHIALVIQKLNRNKENNKGRTLLIFDEQECFSDELANLIFEPPEWIDEFVAFDQRKEETRLNQIIDTAFFVHSHHSSMAQVVDIVAYLFRRRIEIENYGMSESYAGECQKLDNWINPIHKNLIPFGTVYPRGRSSFLEFLRSVKAIGV